MRSHLATRLLQAAGLLRPPLDVRPVPRRTATHGPARLGQQIPLPPHVDRGALDPEAFSDLLDADRLDGHTGTVEKVLTPDKFCSENHYMTKTTQTQPIDVNDDAHTAWRSQINKLVAQHLATEIDLTTTDERTTTAA